MDWIVERQDISLYTQQTVDWVKEYQVPQSLI